MASEVSICNQALGEIGDTTIIMALTDQNKAAKYCKLYYTDTRDALLAMFQWNFAIRRVTLAQLSATPDWGYNFQYQLPADIIKVLREESLHIKYRIENDKLLTDESTAKIKYIKKITTPGDFDPLFTIALVALLAHRLAKPLADGSTQTRRDLMEMFKDRIRQAKAANSMENPIEDLFNDSWLTSRITGVGGGELFRSIS